MVVRMEVRTVTRIMHDGKDRSKVDGKDDDKDDGEEGCEYFASSCTI